MSEEARHTDTCELCHDTGLVEVNLEEGGTAIQSCDECRPIANDPESTRPTPGPWRVSEEYHPKSRDFRIATPRGDYLGEWWSTASIPESEHRANEALIAQAWRIPELLAQRDALLEALRDIENCYGMLTGEDCAEIASATLARCESSDACGHSVCSQHYIDEGA